MRIMRLFIVSLLFCLQSSYLFAERVNIVVDDYPPFIDQQAENKGFMTELVEKAFKLSGFESQVEFSPWKRIEAFEIDQHDKVSFSWIWNQERDKRWLFSNALMASPTILVARKGSSIEWTRYEDLKPYKIALSRGYSYGDEFDRLIPEMDTQTANSDLQNIRKVLAGRVDLFPVDPYVGAMLIRQNFSAEERDQLMLIHEPQFTEPYTMHLVCSKKNENCQKHIEHFNQGLAQLRDTGELQKLIDQALAM